MIVNLTQHPCSKEQEEQGVFNLPASEKEALSRALTFLTLPSREEVLQRAQAVADIAAASGADSAMIGGAMYLMGPLEGALHARGIVPLYAFSQRKSVEVTDPSTGEVKKTAVFFHLGFVEA